MVAQAAAFRRQRERVPLLPQDDAFRMRGAPLSQVEAAAKVQAMFRRQQQARGGHEAGPSQQSYYDQFAYSTAVGAEDSDPGSGGGRGDAAGFADGKGTLASATELSAATERIGEAATTAEIEQLLVAMRSAVLALRARSAVDVRELKKEVIAACVSKRRAQPELWALSVRTRLQELLVALAASAA